MDSAIQLALQKVQRVGSAETDESECSILDEPTPSQRYDSDGDGLEDACRAMSGAQEQRASTINGHDGTDGEYRFVVRSPARRIRADSRGPADAFMFWADRVAYDNPRTSPADKNSHWLARSDRRGEWMDIVGSSGAKATQIQDPAVQDLLRKRVMTVSASVTLPSGRVISRRRNVGFTIVPRVFRAAMFSGGALQVGGSQPASLLTAPWYKGASDARGGDIATNASVMKGTGSGINSRRLDSAAYDAAFLQDGVDVPLGDLITSRPGQQPIEGLRRVQTLATQLNPPVYSKWLRTQRCSITNELGTADAYDVMQCDEAERDDAPVFPAPHRNVLGGTTQLFRPAAFQTFVDSTPNATLNGIVYVDNEPDAGNEATPNCVIRLRNTRLTIKDGGLIVHGCDLEIERAAQLQVVHTLDAVANRRSHARPDLEQRRPVHKAPALVLYPNSNDGGGNLSVQSSGTYATELDGLAFVNGNLVVRADAPPARKGNLTVNGALVVLGTSRIDGTAAGMARVLLRWNPLVQATDFRADGNQMGTYAMRTFDRPAPQRPAIVPDESSLPDQLREDLDSFDIRWDVINGADTVKCTFQKNGVGVPPYVDYDCGDDHFPQRDLERNQDYSLRVEACNIAGCDTWTWGWHVLPAPPQLRLTTVPATTTNYAGGSSTIGFDISGDGTVTARCRLDRADLDGRNPVTITTGPDGWAGCTTLTALGGWNYRGTYKLPSPTVNKRYTVRVAACNEAGCTERAHTFDVVVARPSITFTSVPADPSAHTTSTFTVRFNVVADATVSARCQLASSARGTTPPSGTWTSCSSFGSGAGTTYPGTFAVRGLQANTRYAVRVQATNEAGSTEATAMFDLRAAPPTVWLTSYPSNPNPYYANNAYFAWGVSSASTVTGYQCKVDGGAWYWCSNGTSTGALSKNDSPWGVSHTFAVRGQNESGFGPEASYGYTQYPDPITCTYWGAYPPHIDYPQGSSQGWFEACNGPRRLECYDSAHGYWYGCDNGNQFAAGGYCSDNYFEVRSWNVTSGYVNGGGGWFHRNCAPPSSGIGWGPGTTIYSPANDGPGGAERWANRPHYQLNYWWDGIVTDCRIYNGDLAVWWASSTGCPGTSGGWMNFIRGGVCLYGQLSVRNADSSRYHYSNTGWACS